MKTGTRRSMLFLGVLAALGVGTCALERPPVGDVLAAPQPAGDAGGDAGGDLEREIDLFARAARERALASPDDLAAQLDATRALFDAVDVRAARALAAAIESELPANGEALLRVEDEAVTALGGALLALCDEGRAFAERALELAPENVEALHYRALHMTLAAQAKGPRRALLEGLGGDVVAAQEAALAHDPSFESGAPRVLHGRFLDRAPWPYQDRREGVRELERAVELEATPLRLLFLGDALFGLGDAYERAVETWRRAAAAPPSARARGTPAEALAELARERARARLALVDAGRI